MCAQLHRRNDSDDSDDDSDDGNGSDRSVHKITNTRGVSLKSINFTFASRQTDTYEFLCVYVWLVTLAADAFNRCSYS